MNDIKLSEKYGEVIALLCVIISTMVSFILDYRTPWSIFGAIGGIMQIVGAMGLPLIAMIIGRSFFKDDDTYKDFYKRIFIKFIIPLGAYYIVLKFLALGNYELLDITSEILGILLVAPFLKEFLKRLDEKKLKYLIGLILVGSFVNAYFPIFGIKSTINLSIFYNWIVFCIIGYALPQITCKKTIRNIFKFGIVSVLFTFIMRANYVDFRLWGVSPTLILYSSAAFLWINNLKWTSLEKISLISKSVNSINEHKIGIYFIHNFIICNVLNDKLNINPNRFKVVLGSCIVFVVTMVLSGVIALIMDKIISKNLVRFIKWTKVIIKKIVDLNSYKHYLVWIIVAVVITFISESFQREGMYYAAEFAKVLEHKKFLANFLIALAVTSPCLLFKRAYFVLALISEVLVGFSVASFIMYGFRGTPLTYADFFAIEDGLSIAGQYVNITMLVICGIFIALLVIVNCKLASYKVRMKFNPGKVTFIVIIFAFILAKVNLVYVLNEEILDPITWDIKYSYDENGFFFSLYDSYKSSKREKPKKYNSAYMAEIKSAFDNNLDESQGNEESPNIILIQLESVMDPYDIEGIELSGDPLKNIREISNITTSGNLHVPTFGGGTARTEFEVMTGMSLDYFSPGELPQNTYLKKESVESLAYVLDSNIYENTLIHNYQGSFYGRNKVYENLGFERYIPMEYMYNRKLSGEFPEDELILNNIVETLETTDKRDFIFAIGVQTHGGYSTDYTSEDSEIIVSGDISQEYLNQIQDFVDDLVMVDKMVGDLIQYINELEEPTVLGVYSDHLPSLGIVTENFTQEQKYITPYFIYDNMGLEKNDMDIEAYELSTKILDLVNEQGGVINQFHRAYKDSEDYQERLECLQYDILHGKKYIYDKKNPYSKTTMKMGIRDITVEDVNIIDNTLEVSGQGFNEYSCIYVNGKSLSTSYISENKLVAETSDKDKIDKIKVLQLSRRSKSIGSTEEYIIQK